MVIFFTGIGFAFLALMILIGAVKKKFQNIYNPIRKDNSDYRFIEVKNTKTRSIFKVQK